MPGLAWILNKIILVSTSLLIGVWFPHWLTDYALIWQGPEVGSHAVATSLTYYSHLYHAPPFYVATLSTLAGSALVASACRLILNPVSGLLFDGATFLLLVSALSVYVSNVLAALRYLPLSKLPPVPTASLDSLGVTRLTEALQSIAASNMIIAVSLTGVLMLQGAQGYADRPTSIDQTSVPATGAVPASTTAPIPTKGEKSPEKGLHET
ncbi:Shr3p [Sporobolomyces salmoneus]|uniref:Shr3p n=1 Tax=Sporobolomyces salmoneus TaxID=183962 RepID=UPI003173DE57